MHLVQGTRSFFDKSRASAYSEPAQTPTERPANGFESQRYKEKRSMRTTWMWCVIALLSMGSTAWSQGKVSSGETEKAVAALEQQWLQSQRTNNPDLVAPLLADKIISTGNNGKVSNKAEMLADAKATKYESMEYEDVKVTVFGDTAIATGSSRSKGTDASKAYG